MTILSLHDLRQYHIETLARMKSSGKDMQNGMLCAIENYSRKRISSKLLNIKENGLEQIRY